MGRQIPINLFPSWNKDLPFPEEMLPQIAEAFCDAMVYFTGNKTKWDPANIPEGFTIRDYPIGNTVWLHRCLPSFRNTSIGYSMATGVHPEVFAIILSAKAFQLSVVQSLPFYFWALE